MLFTFSHPATLFAYCLLCCTIPIAAAVIGLETPRMHSGRSVVVCVRRLCSLSAVCCDACASLLLLLGEFDVTASRRAYDCHLVSGVLPIISASSWIDDVLDPLPCSFSPIDLPWFPSSASQSSICTPSPSAQPVQEPRRSKPRETSDTIRSNSVFGQRYNPARCRWTSRA